MNRPFFSLSIPCRVFFSPSWLPRAFWFFFSNLRFLNCWRTEFGSWGITHSIAVAGDGSVFDPFDPDLQSCPRLVARLVGSLGFQFSLLQADDLEFWAGEGDDNESSTEGRRRRRRLSYGLGPDADAQGRYPQTSEGPGSDTPLGDDITEGGGMGIKRHKGLDKVILKDFSELPKDVDYGDYGVVNVSPSIVPAYFPSFRVFNYNISTEAVQEALDRRERRRRGETLGKKPPHGHRKPDPSKPRTNQCKKKEYRDSWRCHFSKDDWHSDPDAPSRKNGLMSPLGFAQVSLGS